MSKERISKVENSELIRNLFRKITFNNRPTTLAKDVLFGLIKNPIYTQTQATLPEELLATRNLFKNLYSKDFCGIKSQLAIPITDFYFLSSDAMKDMIPHVDISLQEFRNKLRLLDAGKINPRDFENSLSSFDSNGKAELEKSKAEQRIEELRNKKDNPNYDQLLVQEYRLELLRQIEVISFLQNIYSFIYIYFRNLEEVSNKRKVADQTFEAMYNVFERRRLGEHEQNLNEQTPLKRMNFKYLYDQWKKDNKNEYAFENFSYTDIPDTLINFVQNLLNEPGDFITKAELKDFCYEVASEIVRFQSHLNYYPLQVNNNPKKIKPKSKAK